ncbi:MAG: hypothetical protein JKY49_05930 [Cohaesibacteraceae bacterium]|nr:hypothetical protein [Cohaesibacteraceae bacterium]MBL4874892.1 hypothetical protein [Cohaesibacteraceae bacterium]
MDPVNGASAAHRQIFPPSNRDEDKNKVQNIGASALFVAAGLESIKPTENNSPDFGLINPAASGPANTALKDFDFGRFQRLTEQKSPLEQRQADALEKLSQVQKDIQTTLLNHRRSAASKKANVMDAAKEALASRQDSTDKTATAEALLMMKDSYGQFTKGLPRNITNI